jgi:hypothetical protein
MGRESDDKDKDGQSSGSLFDRAAPFNPAA